jgi:hypothetical protein
MASTPRLINGMANLITSAPVASTSTGTWAMALDGIWITEISQMRIALAKMIGAVSPATYLKV